MNFLSLLDGTWFLSVSLLSIKCSSPHKNNVLNDANQNKFITKNTNSFLCTLVFGRNIFESTTIQKLLKTIFFSSECVNSYIICVFA